MSYRIFRDAGNIEQDFVDEPAGRLGPEHEWLARRYERRLVGKAISISAHTVLSGLGNSCLQWLKRGHRRPAVGQEACRHASSALSIIRR
jgi:hypothetical protein